MAAARRGARPWGRAVVLLAVLAFVLLARPDADGVRVLGGRVPELCAWASGGHSCPGCGATRGTLALLHGDLPGAWSVYPASLPLDLLLLLNLLVPAPGPRLRRVRGLLLWSFLLLALGVWGIHVVSSGA